MVQKFAEQTEVRALREVAQQWRLAVRQPRGNRGARVGRELPPDRHNASALFADHTAAVMAERRRPIGGHFSAARAAAVERWSKSKRGDGSPGRRGGVIGGATHR